MAPTFRRQPSRGEMLVLQLAIVVVVLLAVAAVSLAQSKATFNRVEGRRVTALAEQLAATPLVRSQLLRPVPQEALAPLVNATQTQSGVTSVTVADADGRVVSSTDPTLIGARLPRGAGAGVSSGWSGPLTVQGSRELVAQVPVLGATRQTLGRHLGTVMVGEADPTAWQRLSGASSYLLAYLGIASGLGVAGSWLLARRVKRQTLGLEPREIAGLAEHREAMLYGIAEGVVALDPQRPAHPGQRDGPAPARPARRLCGPEPGRPRHRRPAARRPRRRHLRDGRAARRGRRPPRPGPGHEPHDRHQGRPPVRLGHHPARPHRTGSPGAGDRLLPQHLELLRAQAHEFANQLHTISGLIQIGEQDEVVRYVRGLNQRRQSLDVTLSRRVRDTAVAALITAKSSLAAERRVALRVSDRTALDRLEPADAADVATVVGNLVDNAVDAAAPPDDAHEAWVEVELGRTPPASRSSRTAGVAPNWRGRSSPTASPPRPPGRASAVSAWR
ncbi:histidine kinase OS=Streptomyces tendae OX=1932 GN=GUR47_29125 PE=4 SV=1 [Streptomyces tendae]